MRISRGLAPLSATARSLASTTATARPWYPGFFPLRHFIFILIIFFTLLCIARGIKYFQQIPKIAISIFTITQVLFEHLHTHFGLWHLANEFMNWLANFLYLLYRKDCCMLTYCHRWWRFATSCLIQRASRGQIATVSLWLSRLASTMPTSMASRTWFLTSLATRTFFLFFLSSTLLDLSLLIAFCTSSYLDRGTRYTLLFLGIIWS